MNKEFDGFTVNVFFDEEGDWLAHLVELPNISAFSDTPEKAIEELSVAWQATKESYIKDGEEVPKPPKNKDYSGQFNIRIDKRIHKSLAMEAAQAGISLNALVAQKLALTTHL